MNPNSYTWTTCANFNHDTDPTSHEDRRHKKVFDSTKDKKRQISKPKKRPSSKYSIASATTFNNHDCIFPVNKLDESNPNFSSDLKLYLKLIYDSIELKKYSTSALDLNRTFLTVYQYKVNNQYIIWDYETGLVHLTGMWKATLANDLLININSKNSVNYGSKADIVKLLESTPKEYQPYIKRIRGGFLKIQGTWMPHKLCQILARRFCYNIRYELIPIFGSNFPNSCLKPNDLGFGELKFDQITTEEEIDLKISLKPLPPPTTPTPKKSLSTSPKNIDNYHHNNNYNNNYSIYYNSSSGSSSDNSISINKLPRFYDFPVSRRNSDIVCPLEPMKQKLPSVGELNIPKFSSYQPFQHYTVNQINSKHQYLHQTPSLHHAPTQSQQNHIQNSLTSHRSMNLISSISSSDSLYLRVSKFSDYDDVSDGIDIDMDIVNASRCLQSFKENAASPLKSPLRRDLNPSFLWPPLGHFSSDSNCYKPSISQFISESNRYKTSNTRNLAATKPNPLSIHDLIS